MDHAWVRARRVTSFDTQPTNVVFQLRVGPPAHVLLYSAVLLVPELVLGRLVESLTAMLAHELGRLEGRRATVEEFCQKVDVVRNAFEKVGKVRSAADERRFIRGGGGPPKAWHLFFS